MTQKEIERAFVDAMCEWHKIYEDAPVKKKTPEFSKQLMFFASAMFALILAVSIVSWFQSGEMPLELFVHVTRLYAIALAIYGGKSTYENSLKITKSGR